jgi:hypothetical protein
MPWADTVHVDSAVVESTVAVVVAVPIGIVRKMAAVAARKVVGSYVTFFINMFYFFSVR